LGGHIHYHSGTRGKSTTMCITEKLHDSNIIEGLKFIGNLHQPAKSIRTPLKFDFKITLS